MILSKKQILGIIAVLILSTTSSVVLPALNMITENAKTKIIQNIMILYTFAYYIK